MLYSTSTFKAAKLDNIAEYGTVGIGALNVIMTIVAVFVVDLLGRKVCTTEYRYLLIMIEWSGKISSIVIHYFMNVL